MTEKEIVREDLMPEVQSILAEVFNVKDKLTVIIPSPRAVAEAIRKLGREDLLLYKAYF